MSRSQMSGSEAWIVFNVELLVSAYNWKKSKLSVGIVPVPHAVTS